MASIVIAPLEKAVQYHDAKTPVGSKLRSEDWLQTVPVQIQEVSQASATVESARVLQRIQDGVGEILGHRRNELGGITDRSGLMRDLMQIANEEGIRPAADDAKRGTIQDIGSEARTALIYEMQTGSAYGYAQWQTGQDPDMLDAFPAQELVRVRQAKQPRDWDTRWAAAGQKVGWVGAAKSPKVALKNSPIWVALSRFERAFPPFDFGSGMWVEDVEREQAVKLGLLAEGDQVKPEDKPFAENWQTSVKDLSPELRQSLQEAFPERVSIQGDTAQWNPGSSAGASGAKPPMPSGPTAPTAPTPARWISKESESGSTTQSPSTTLSQSHERQDLPNTSAMSDSRGTLEAAAAITRGGGSPAPTHDESRSERIARIQRETEHLRSWADHRGLLIAKSLPADELHGEHGVYYDSTTDRYVKFTRPDKHQGYGIALGSQVHGASPSEYLDRLALHNELFNDDVRLEGVRTIPGGKLSIVTSQPRIAGEPATPAEIDALMAEKGFERLTSGAYLDRQRGLLVYDAFSRNVVHTVDGLIAPIDAVVQRISPDFADFLIRHPERIHDRP